MKFPKMTAIKWHTLIKGLIWEALGVLILFAYTWLTTGSLHVAASIGIGYPAARFGLWYPYERIYKRIRRRNTEYNAYMLLTVKKEHDATIIKQAAVNCASRLATNGITRGKERDAECVANNAFAVSRELLESARTNPITAQWIRDRVEEEITGRKPKHQLSEFPVVRGEAQRIDDMRHRMKLNRPAPLPMRRATKEDGPPPLPDVNDTACDK